MKTLFLSILFVASMTTQCNSSSHTSPIIKIEYGTSFGSCIGYCFQTITLEDGKASKYLRPQRAANLKEKTCSQAYDGFEKLTNQINLEGFYALNETIGCPDCADGGAEWVEIFTEQGSKKVMYEFGNAPKEVSPYIKELRTYLNKLGECE